MRYKNILWVLFCLFVSTSRAQNLDVGKQLDYCNKQVMRALQILKPFGYSLMPRNILKTDSQEGWNCRMAMAEEWCSGFWPGILWMDYQYTKDEKIRKIAENYTQSLEFLAERPAYDHDLGFIVINSFLKGFEITKNEHYREIALKCADSLATLFNPNVGTILSWPRHVDDYGGHNTIMDNMINLELLFWASENGGDTRLRDMAVKHADTTMKYHFRPDGSCFHVAVYNPKTGKFIKGVTHQGYADWSMWARGQAWAVYGYTMVYRFTREERFLQHAIKVTDAYLKKLKQTSDDWVPIWDMDDPRGTNAPKDASAACVVADALVELSAYVNQPKQDEYINAAVNMITELSSDKYLSNNDNVAFLKHSTGHHPAGSEIDASIIYADYYYIEALLRLYSMKQ